MKTPQGLRPSIPANCDPTWRQIMESCWSNDPEQRPNMSEIVDRLGRFAKTL